MSNLLKLNFNDNPSAVFSPKQAVAGTIKLTLKEAVQARGLLLIVKGEAECNWSEMRGYGNTKRKLNYSGKEVYLNSVTYMFGAENGETIEVPAGVHIYNFECVLPELLPYSVEIDNGFVRYNAVATLDIPLGSDYESEKPFAVVRHDDLNLTRFPKYRLPCEVEEIKTFCCLFCKSKPLLMTMRVSKTGFGLGENIPIHIEVINISKNNVCSTEFSLIKFEQFNAPSKTKIRSSVVTSKISQGIRAGETVDFVEFLEIPRTLPTSNGRFCKVFQISYEIRFKANTDGYSDLAMSIGVEIANVGIVDVTSLVSVAAINDTRVQKEPPTLPDLPSTSKILDDSPPTFEEATQSPRSSQFYST